MLKSYFLIAWRSFQKNRFLTVINMLGLSIGIVASLIVYLVIDYNFSFDRFEPDRDRIYRVVSENSGSSNFGVPAPLHEAMTSVTGISDIVPLFEFYAGNSKVVISGQAGQAQRVFKDQGSIVFTNGAYFNLFPHDWIAGDPHHPLSWPNEAILTQDRAATWFPGTAPAELIGKTMVLNDSVTFTITGIVKNLAANSDFEYLSWLSLSTIESARLTDNYSWTKWSVTSSMSQLLIKTSPGVVPKGIDRQLARITSLHLTGEEDKHTIRRLQPLADIHTNTQFSGKISKPALASLAMLAFFLLLLGCINFINLSTAQGAQRAKEIGIRKTFGGNKKQLIGQFLTETFLLTTITCLVAFAALLFILPSFLPEEALHSGRMLHWPSLAGFFVCLIVVLTLLSGLYPAFVLSRFQPIRMLKTGPSAGPSSSRPAILRKVLTISQFTIAQIFLIGVFMVNKQIHYSLEKDMGFRKNAVLNIQVPPTDSLDYIKKNQFSDRLKQLPGIEQLSIGSQSPAFSGQTGDKIGFNQGAKEQEVNIDLRSGDAGYIKVYDIHLVAGRDLRTTDSAEELLINETLARQLGFSYPADAVGKFVTRNNMPLPIVGVVKDFNQASVRSSIHPLVLYSNVQADRTLHIALEQGPGDWQRTIGKIRETWKAVYPDQDFNYSFVDENIAKLYRQDTALSSLLSFAAGIAILVSCIGLLGLTLFSINSRGKEIGIRKVLGASLPRILGSLGAGFVWPLLIAFAIATPLAWLACHAYLQNFAFHTTLSWWIFILSGGMMTGIALVTVGFHTWKAAHANPVDSLREE